MRLRAGLLALGLMVLLAVAPVQAAETATPEAAWQASITSQIEAFRAGDGETALLYAGHAFKQEFGDAETFLWAIAQMGYEPLLHSRSHSFGAFEQFDETHAMQIVNIVGPDQLLYEALYQMMMEKEGWRVEAVTLKQSEGLAI
jgi:hypothetical protein